MAGTGTRGILLSGTVLRELSLDIRLFRRTDYDWGGHHPDIAQWGMGTELTGPIEIRPGAVKWADHPIYNTATEYTFEANLRERCAAGSHEQSARRCHVRRN